MKNLKKLSFVCVMIFIASTLFLTGCKKEEPVIQTPIVQTSHWNMIAGDDPKIVKELEYLRDHKFITSKTYDHWIKLPKNYFMMRGNSYVDEKGITQQDELYAVPPYNPLPVGMMTDPEFIDRQSIQEKIKINVKY